MIEGVLVTELKRVAVPAGDVLHALKASAPGYAGFGEAYFSEIHAGVVKSWRRHTRATLNLVVPAGNVRFVVHDDRADSKTRGEFREHVLGSRHYARLSVAPGLWLAFQGIGPGTSLILDISSQEHDPAESMARELSAFPYDW